MRHIHVGIWTLVILAAGMALVNVSMRTLAEWMERRNPGSPAAAAVTTAF